jgi:hypothetical protein
VPLLLLLLSAVLLNAFAPPLLYGAYVGPGKP